MSGYNLKSLAQQLRREISSNVGRHLVRDVITLGGGTVLAQIVNFSFYPVLTRQFSPRDFGELGNFTALVAVLTPLAGLTYHFAIILPASERRALRLLVLSISVGLALSGLVGAMSVWFFYSGFLRSQFSSHAVPIFLAPCLAATAILLALQQWQSRQRQFVLLSVSGVVQAFSTNLPRVVLGISTGGPMVLIATFVLGLAAQALVLFPWLHPSFARTVVTQSLVRLHITAKAYRRLPMYRGPQEFLSAASQGLPVFILSYLYSPVEAGLYVLARSVVGAPLDLIGNAVGGALFPRYAEHRIAGPALAKSIRVHTLLLFGVGLVPMMIAIPGLPFVFEVIFGRHWHGAGIYGSLLGLWLFSNVVNVPSLRAIPILAAERLQLAFGVITTFARIGALFATAALGASATVSIAAFCSVGVLANGALTLAIYVRAKNGGESPEQAQP